MPTLVSQQYPELLHYTNLAGLRGILSSNCMWATDAAYLNDSSEIAHFFDVRLQKLVLDDAQKYAIELARVPQNLATILNDGGFENVISRETELWQSTLRNVTLSMNKPFVLSLSGPSDARIMHSGLLSQWRGYGGEGGYALVLDTARLEDMLTTEARSHHYMHVQIGDVYYHGVDPSIQPASPEVAEYEAIIHEGVSKMMRGSTAEETERFYEAVTALSCLYKHWGFWEEREVRVVVLPASDEVANAGKPHAAPAKEIKSFLRGEKQIPYVELFTARDEKGTPRKLPINRIIVGPHKDRELHAEALKELLASVGCEAGVVQSEIPYIGK